MPHAAPLTITALGLVSLLALSACDRSANSPASPRTSEIVHLSQAPIDAVPLAAEMRPVERPVQTPTPVQTAKPEVPTEPTPPVAIPAPVVPAPIAPVPAPAPPLTLTPAAPAAPAPQNPNPSANDPDT